jgi:hypothetical protein
VKLEDVILTPGTRAAQPNAADVPRGTLYYVTDEDRLERSNGTAWDEYAAPPGGGSGGGASDFDRGNVVLIQRASSSGNIYVVVGGETSSEQLSGTAARARDGQNLYTQCTSAATAGSSVGLTTGFYLCELGSYPILDAIVWSPNDLTDVRMYVGLFGNSPSNSDSPPTHSACFRFSSVAGDTGWTPLTRDATTTVNVGTTMGTVVASTRYRLRIRRDANGVHFSIDGGAEQTLTANLPSDTQGLAVAVRMWPTTNSARTIGIDRARLIYGAPL